MLPTDDKEESMSELSPPFPVSRGAAKVCSHRLGSSRNTGHINPKVGATRLAGFRTKEPRNSSRPIANAVLRQTTRVQFPQLLSHHPNSLQLAATEA